jgi:hypothetical protein
VTMPPGFSGRFVYNRTAGGRIEYNPIRRNLGGLAAPDLGEFPQKQPPEPCPCPRGGVQMEAFQQCHDNYHAGTVAPRCP